MSDTKNLDSESDKKNILIVDDDRNTSLLIKRILDVNNFDSTNVNDGKNAIDFLKNNTPDLILMDVMMPIVDGIEATRIIKKDDRLKNIPIIFLTAQDDEKLIKDFFNLGIVDYISKPFRNLELVARIKSAIKSKDERQDLLKDKNVLIDLNKLIIKKSDDLEKQNRRLQDLDAIKDTFIACITHDFKTPITSIRALSELMYEDKNIPVIKKREFLKTIINQSDVLNEMVLNLLDSFKRVSQSFELQLFKTNLPTLIGDINYLIQPMAVTKGLEFNCKIDLNTNDIVCDTNKIKELLTNLLTNAIKFTESGGINFFIYEDDIYIFFDVIDTGIGISEDNQLKIFDKFYRVKKASKLKEGSGLGLYIAKKVAEAHRGDIVVKSEPEKGSKFSFYIPKKR